MTPSELKHLKELAEKATPGPWKYAELNGDDRDDGSTWGAVGLWTQNNKQIFGSGDNWSAEFNEPSQQDSDYIAAANPKTILKMIETIERYRGALDVCRIAFEVEQKRCGRLQHPLLGAHNIARAALIGEE